MVQPLDDDSRAIAEFNRLLYASREMFTTIIPLRDDGIPEAGAIDVQPHAMAPRHLGDLTLVDGGQRLGHRVGVRVLEGHEAR